MVAHSTLTVAFNGIPIGHLIKHRAGGLSFQYLTPWLERSGARAISLSMPLREKAYVGDVVYNFFDNLLPDNPQIRSRIQSHFKIPTKHPYDLLSSIGMDCVGAIQLYTEQANISPITQIHATPITDDEISQLLLGYQTMPLGMGQIQDDFRISLAGAQEKTALLWYKGKWHKPHGATPTSHIFKLPIGFLQHQQLDLSKSCENEWFCLALANAYGLPVAQAEVCWFNNNKALVVERFDRQWSRDKQWLMRLPQEDICQALGISSSLKYEADGGPGIQTTMDLLLGSESALEDRETFMKTQLFFWMIAAIDGHAKNFSLFLKPNNQFKLTPLYDIISAYPFIGANGISKQKIQMAMGLLSKNKHYHWHTIQPRHFESTADNVGFSRTKLNTMMHQMMEQTEDAIESVLRKMPAWFDTEIPNKIIKGLRTQLTHWKPKT